MGVSVQFHMEVLSDYVPIEITGVCNRKTFYYRSRHQKWGIWNHIVDCGNVPFSVGGKCEDDTSMEDALERIMTHVVIPEYRKMAFNEAEEC